VTGYVVPARRLLTVVHEPHPDQDDRTACGEVMAPADLWVPWQYDPTRDRLCPRCAGTPAPEDVPLIPLRP
jgi:hypothetical protein